MKVKPVSNLEKVLNEINLENNIPIVEIVNNINKTKTPSNTTSSADKSVKTLSPLKSSSPIERTNSSWNSNVNKMFNAVNNDLALPEQNVWTNVIPQNKEDDGIKDRQSIIPYLVRKNMSELNNPSTSAFFVDQIDSATPPVGHQILDASRLIENDHLYQDSSCDKFVYGKFPQPGESEHELVLGI